VEGVNCRDLLLSIVFACHNQEEFVREYDQSVLSQGHAQCNQGNHSGERFQVLDRALPSSCLN
jgi:hypothetical protein